MENYFKIDLNIYFWTFWGNYHKNEKFLATSGCKNYNSLLRFSKNYSFLWKQTILVNWVILWWYYSYILSGCWKQKLREINWFNTWLLNKDHYSYFSKLFNLTVKHYVKSTHFLVECKCKLISRNIFNSEITVWKLQKFSLTLFRKNFVKAMVLLKRNY